MHPIDAETRETALHLGIIMIVIEFVMIITALLAKYKLIPDNSYNSEIAAVRNNLPIFLLCTFFAFIVFIWATLQSGVFIIYLDGKPIY